MSRDRNNEDIEKARTAARKNWQQTNINEGAEKVKTEQNENGAHNGAEVELRKADSTAMSADELTAAVTGDPWEWYCSELEKGLGKVRAQKWLDRPDEEFEALLIEIKEETWASFPIDVLPPVLGDLAKSIALAHKSEDKIGVIALPLIAVFSGSLGQGVVVKTKHYISYPNLFVYCSVGSGGIKSVVIDEAEAPVIEFQKSLFKRYEQETKPAALAELRKIETQIEAMKDFPDGDDEEVMSELAQLYHRKAEAEKELEFCPVKLDDFTPEAMVMHGINNGRVFISSDEGGIVADILCGRYSKGFTNDGPMCKIWSSSYLSRKRKDGLIWKDCVTGSMLLMGQEHITEQMFQNENMVTSGFIPRLLFATAETPMLYKDKNRPAVCEDARGNYRDVIIKVLQKYWDKAKEAAPIIIGMTEEAQDAIDDFHNSYVDRGNTTLADAKRSLHRIAEQATRIALIFHVAKVYGSMAGLDSDVTDINEPIGLSTVQAAIKVTEWSLQSYLEYSRPGREDTLDELEIDVLSKAKGFSEPFTVRGMQRKVRSKKLTGSEHLASILDELVKKGKLTFAAGKYSLPTKKA
jgi:polyhydroxyalkanoate synthesis regulator phasin